MPLNQLLLNTIRTEIDLIAPGAFIMGPLNDAANFCLKPAITLWGGRQVRVISDEDIPTQIFLEGQSTERKIFTICQLILLLVPGMLLRLVTLLNHDIRRGFTCTPIVENKVSKLVFNNPLLKQEKNEVNRENLNEDFLLIEDEDDENELVVNNNLQKEKEVNDENLNGISLPFSFVPKEFFQLSGKPYFQFLISLEDNPVKILRNLAKALRTNSLDIISVHNGFLKTEEGAPYAYDLERFLKYHYRQCIEVEWDLVLENGSWEKSGMESHVIDYLLIIKCIAPEMGLVLSEEDERSFLKQVLGILRQSPSISKIKQNIQRNLLTFKQISLTYTRILAEESLFKQPMIANMLSWMMPTLRPQHSETKQINKNLYQEITKKLRKLNLTEYLCSEEGMIELESKIMSSRSFREQSFNEMKKNEGFHDFFQKMTGLDLSTVTIEEIEDKKTTETIFNKMQENKAVKKIFEDMKNQLSQMVAIPEELFTLSEEKYFQYLSDNKNRDSSLKNFREAFLSADDLVKLSQDLSFSTLLKHHLVQCWCALYDIYTQALPLETLKLYEKYLAAIAKANKNEEFQKFVKDFENNNAKFLETVYDDFYSRESLSEVHKENMSDLIPKCKVVSMALYLFRAHVSENPETINKCQRVIETVLGKNTVFDEQIKQKNDELLSSDSLLDETLNENELVNNQDDDLLDDAFDELVFT